MININIYAKEMKQYKGSFIAWSVSIAVLILMGIAFYPIVMQGDMLEQLSAFFENPFMKNMLSAFGVSVDDWTNILGFYTARNALFIMLLGSFFSILLAGRILAREEMEKTAEFLLTRPVTRPEVLGSKLAAFFTYLLLLNVVIMVIGFVSLEIFKGNGHYSLKAFFIHSFYSFLLMLIFGAFGFFLSVLIKRGRPITNISLGIVVGAYFLDFLSKMSASVDKIGYMSPFKFVDVRVLHPDYGLNWWRVLYFVGVSVVFFTLTFFIYKKKDILV